MRAHTCTGAHTCTHMYEHAREHVHTCICMPVCAHMCIYACTHAVHTHPCSPSPGKAWAAPPSQLTRKPPPTSTCHRVPDAASEPPPSSGREGAHHVHFSRALGPVLTAADTHSHLPPGSCQNQGGRPQLTPCPWLSGGSAHKGSGQPAPEPAACPRAALSSHAQLPRGASDVVLSHAWKAHWLGTRPGPALFTDPESTSGHLLSGRRGSPDFTLQSHQGLGSDGSRGALSRLQLGREGRGADGS